MELQGCADIFANSALSASRQAIRGPANLAMQFSSRVRLSSSSHRTSRAARGLQRLEGRDFSMTIERKTPGAGRVRRLKHANNRGAKRSLAPRLVHSGLFAQAGVNRTREYVTEAALAPPARFRIPWFARIDFRTIGRQSGISSSSDWLPRPELQEVNASRQQHDVNQHDGPPEGIHDPCRGSPNRYN